MSRKISIFVDSDVVISSIISKSGAAYLLLTSKEIEKIVSNVSKTEIGIVAGRMNLKTAETESIVGQCKIIKLNLSPESIGKKYQRFVHDVNDAHIVAGAISSKAKFLITYNAKDYKTEELKRSFDLIILTPALFIQYLRSRS